MKYSKPIRQKWFLLANSNSSPLWIEQGRSVGKERKDSLLSRVNGPIEIASDTLVSRPQRSDGQASFDKTKLSQPARRNEWKSEPTVCGRNHGIQLRCRDDHKWGFQKGFNDAFHLGRQFERDELAKRAPEWETFGKQIIKEIDERLDCGYMPGMSTYLKIAYQQKSLHYEAVIEKLQKELRQAKSELAFVKEYLNPSDTSFRQMIDAFKTLSKENQNKLIELSSALANIKGVE